MNNDIQPQGFGAFLKGWFKQLGYALSHPLMLLPTLLISAAWIALGILHTRLGETKAIAILNFFTFAQGGLFGGTAGAIGGILGKLLIATLLNAMILPLFTKGAKPFARFGKGFKGLFGSFAFDSLRALSVFLFGLAIALGVYSFFNITQRWQESLVGVVAAVMLIRNIGQRGGLLFSLLFSMVSAFTKGHSPSFVGVTRFLSGMVLGFTIGTGLNAFGLRWCVLVAAGFFLVALIFVFFGNKQRAAFATVSIAAMLMLPLYAESPSASLSAIQQSGDELRAASMKHATELQPYYDEIIELTHAVQSLEGEDLEKAQEQLEAAQKRYHDMLVKFARQDAAGGNSGAKSGSNGQMPQEMQDLYDKANDQSIGSKVEQLQELAAEAEARGDHAAADRYAEQIAELYMGQAAAAMDLYKMAQGYSAPDDPEMEEKPELTEEDKQFLEDINPFGKGPGADDNDWKPSSPEGGLGKIADKAGEILDQVGDIIDPVKQVATEGWADEDSRVDEEDEVSLIEGVGAGVALGAGAAGAAGAAGGGAGGGLPDLPDGEGPSWDAEEVERREEEDETEDQPTDGDGGPDPYDPYEGSKVPQNANVRDNGDGTITMTSPSTGEQITLVPDGNGGWENPLSGAKYDNNDVNEWVRGQDENAAHWQNQAQTNQDYKDAFDQDASDFASRSEEARIDQEIAADEKAAEEQAYHDRVIDKANEYGVKTTDDKGNERNIDEIKDETKKEIKKDVIHDTNRYEQDIQQICAEVELECSEKIATCEMVDQVSEGTVNVLAEYVPGGDKVKDFHTFTKATAVGGMEGYLKGGWSGAAKGVATGAAEGSVGVLQNHLNDLTKDLTGNKTVDTLAGDTLNVQMEGVKVMIHDAARGKGIEEIYDDVRDATVKKTGDILVGKIIGTKVTDEHDSNALGELISKGHDSFKWGGDGDPENDKTLAGHISSGFQNLKDGAAESVYSAYYSLKSGF